MSNLPFLYLGLSGLTLYHAVRDFLQAQGDNAWWVNFWHWTLPYIDPDVANAGSFVVSSVATMIFLYLFIKARKKNKEGEKEV